MVDRKDLDRQTRKEFNRFQEGCVEENTSTAGLVCRLLPEDNADTEFDLYYEGVQKRIKDQQWPNADYPAAKKIDDTIAVDMLLTGFDSKYLNTLYVDKNLKHHGLIQAF